MSSAPNAHQQELPRCDEAASRLAALFERHGRMVYGLCRALLRDVHEAEDAMQQTFVSAYRALLRGSEVRDEAAWIAAIARNECRARIAAGMRTPVAVGDQDLEWLATHHDESERRRQAEEIRLALSALPPRQREAAALRYVYGLPYGEVATALGLSRPAVEALLFRARRAMRIRLRSVVGNVLVVPVELRDRLAEQIPGLIGSGGGAAASVGAVGVLGKIAAVPTVAKLATAVLAAATVGTVGVGDSEVGKPPAPVPRTALAAPAPTSSSRPAHALTRAAPDRTFATVEPRRGRSEGASTGSEDSGSSGSSGGASGNPGPSNTHLDAPEGRAPEAPTEGPDHGPSAVTSGNDGPGTASGAGSSGPSGSSGSSESAGSSSGPGDGVTTAAFSSGSGSDGSSGSGSSGSSGRNSGSGDLGSSGSGSSGSSGSSGGG